MPFKGSDFWAGVTRHFSGTSQSSGPEKSVENSESAYGEYSPCFLQALLCFWVWMSPLHLSAPQSHLSFLLKMSPVCSFIHAFILRESLSIPGCAQGLLLAVLRRPCKMLGSMLGECPTPILSLWSFFFIIIKEPPFDSLVGSSVNWGHLDFTQVLWGFSSAPTNHMCFPT